MTDAELNELKAEDIKIHIMDEAPDIEPGRKFLIVGAAGSGKDTASCMLAKMFEGIRYGGSTSLNMLPLVRNIYGRLTGEYPSNEEFYKMRESLRPFWFECIAAHRLVDPLFVIKRALVGSDIICGCRDIREIVSALKAIPQVNIIYMTGGNSDPTWAFNPYQFRVAIHEAVGAFDMYVSKGTPVEILDTLNGIVDLKPVKYGKGIPIEEFERYGVDYGVVLRRTLSLELSDW